MAPWIEELLMSNMGGGRWSGYSMPTYGHIMADYLARRVKNLMIAILPIYFLSTLSTLFDIHLFSGTVILKILEDIRRLTLEYIERYSHKTLA